MAESKRLFVFNLPFNFNAGTLAPGQNVGATYIYNPFTQLTGTGLLSGDDFLNPLLVLRLTAAVDYSRLIAAHSAMPTITVTVALIAVNDQISTPTSRITTIGEDAMLYLRYPTSQMRWMFNGDNVTVIKKKKLIIDSKDVTPSGANPVVFRQMKVVARLRGKKEMEQTTTVGGLVQNMDYLKGWNFLWVVTSQAGIQIVNSTTINPLVLNADHYMYFKDF